MRSSLVFVQVSLSFVLLVGAGLLLKSLQVAQDTSPGFSTQGDELLKIFHEVPGDANMDLTLMEQWGKLLGLTGWYEFVVPST